MKRLGFFSLFALHIRRIVVKSCNIRNTTALSTELNLIESNVMIIARTTSHHNLSNCRSCDHVSVCEIDDFII